MPSPSVQGSIYSSTMHLLPVATPKQLQKIEAVRAAETARLRNLRRTQPKPSVISVFGGPEPPAHQHIGPGSSSDSSAPSPKTTRRLRKSEERQAREDAAAREKVIKKRLNRFKGKRYTPSKRYLGFSRSAAQRKKKKRSRHLKKRRSKSKSRCRRRRRRTSHRRASSGKRSRKGKKSRRRSTRRRRKSCKCN